MNINFTEIKFEDMNFLEVLMNKKEILDSLQENETDLKHWQKYFSEHCKNENENHHIIHLDNEKVGWLSLKGFLRQDIDGYIGKEKIWLDMLMILPEFQRRGIGKAALKFIEQLIIQYGFSQIGIYTYTSNTPARNLYNSCGYNEISTHYATIPSGVRVEIVTFEKILNCNVQI